MTKEMVAACAALLLVGLFSTSAQALPTPIKTELSVYTQAYVAGGDFMGTLEPAWANGIAPMAVSSSAYSGFDGASANAYGLGAFGFSSPEAGNVSFANLGWRTENLLGGSVQLNARFLYQFTMNENGRLSLFSEITSDGGFNDPAMGNFDFLLSSVGYAPLMRDVGIQEYAFTLRAGTTYTMLFEGSWSGSGALGTQGHSEDASFIWRITPTDSQVPEPDGLLLLGLSLTLLFAARRSRACSL